MWSEEQTLATPGPDITFNATSGDLWYLEPEQCSWTPDVRLTVDEAPALEYDLYLFTANITANVTVLISPSLNYLGDNTPLQYAVSLFPEIQHVTVHVAPSTMDILIDRARARAGS